MYVSESIRKELVKCYLLFTDILDRNKINKWIESLDEDEIKSLLEYKKHNPKPIYEHEWVIIDDNNI